MKYYTGRFHRHSKHRLPLLDHLSEYLEVPNPLETNLDLTCRGRYPMEL